jgi:hypothetical protein
MDMGKIFDPFSQEMRCAFWVVVQRVVKMETWTWAHFVGQNVGQGVL